MSALLLAVLAAALLPGCSSGEGGASDADDAPAEDPLAGASRQVVKLQATIERAMASGDCNRINRLNPISRPDFDTPDRCESLQRLDGLAPAGGEAYGRGGAVLDYEQGERTLSVAAILDSDKRFHVALIDSFLGEPTVVTKEPKQMKDAAKRIVATLPAGDCEAVLAVAYRRSGPGAGEDKQACAQLQAHPLGTLLRLSPDAEVKSLGGNASFGFFSIRSEEAEMTMIVARQEKSDLPDAPKLPKAAPELGFAGAFEVSGKAPKD